MYKFTIIATLLTASVAGFANTSAPEKETVYTSVRNLPVIVKNEILSADTCRLSFESGLSKDVPCSPYAGTETVASAQPVKAPTDSATQ